MHKNLGIGAPTNFPDAEYGQIKVAVDVHCTTYSKPAELRKFGESWNGMAYRYKAAFDVDQAYTSSVQQFGATPPHPIRYAQERDLFDFFTNSMSALETMGRGLDTMARLTGASFATQPRPYLKDVAKAFRAAFPFDGLTTILTTIVSDALFASLKDTRDALSHGGQPPRDIGIGGKSHDPVWGQLVIDQHTTRHLMQWINQTMTTTLQAAVVFSTKL